MPLELTIIRIRKYAKEPYLRYQRIYKMNDQKITHLRTASEAKANMNLPRAAIKAQNSQKTPPWTKLEQEDP